MATNMYLFHVYRLVSLIGPTKSRPHFMNGYYGRVVINLAKLCVANPPMCWHASHDLKKSLTFLYIVGHKYLASKIFFCVILVAKFPLVAPSCNSITFWAFLVDKHLLNLLSYPILYKISLFIVKGLTFWLTVVFPLLTKTFPSVLFVKTF
jgi:hypothetical protein